MYNRQDLTKQTGAFLWRLAAQATFCGVLLALAATTASAQGVVTNPFSQFPVVVDGQFTNGVGTGEWSDITPIAFISPAATNGTLFRTSLDDPRANSLLYAAIAQGVTEEQPELYLLYDYAPRTNGTFAPGEFIADISFPIDLPEQFGGPAEDQLITVQFRGAQLGDAGSGVSAFDIFVDVNGDHISDFSADALGMEGDLGIGPSTLTSNDHLIVELGVPLKIPAGFGSPPGPFPQSGINPATGLYDPDPAFWGAGIANNDVDPPASSAIFTILPNGSTIIDPTFVPLAPAAVPEPSVLAFLGASALSLVALRRKRG